MIIFTGGHSGDVHGYFSEFARNSRLRIKVVSVTEMPWFVIGGWRKIPLKHLRQIADTRVAASCAKHNFLAICKKPLQAAKRLEIYFLWLLYYGYLRKNPSPLIGVWNGVKPRSKTLSLVAAACHRHIVYFENGIFPNSMTLDDRGINAQSSLPRSPEFYLQNFPPPASSFSKSKYDDFNKKLARELTRESEINPATNLPNNYIFVPLQGEFDFQLLYQGTWIKTMADLREVLKKVMPRLDDKTLKFVFKCHPRSEPRTFEKSNEKDNKIKQRMLYLNKDSADTLIGGARAVITVNSMVGMLALMRGKPVISLEDSCYSIKGLVHPARSVAELVNTINTLSVRKLDPQLRKNYLRYVLDYYLIPGSRKTSIKAPTKALTKAHWQSMDARLQKMLKGEPWLVGVNPS